MDVTNSTKFKLSLLSLSNVVNIKFETFSTVSNGSNKLNISLTFSFPNVPYFKKIKQSLLEYNNFLETVILTSGHSIMNCLYHSLMSSTENLVLVIRNSTSSSVRDFFLFLVFISEAFHRSFDFIHDKIVVSPPKIKTENLFSCESSSRNAIVRLSVCLSVRNRTFFQLINQPNKHQT